MSRSLTEYFDEISEVIVKSRTSLMMNYLQARTLMIDAFDAQKKLLIFGNGGSAADADHFAGELISTFEDPDRPGLPAISLTNVAALTAIGNDYGYEFTFADCVDALGSAGDVAIGISTSGKSENVINGLVKARDNMLKTVLLTGKSDTNIADVSISVPSDCTAHIQEIHQILIHSFCRDIDRYYMEVENDSFS